MALDLGDLVLHFRGDDADLARTFDRVDRRIRDFAGSSARMGQSAGDALGTGFTRGADGRLRDAKGRFVKAGSDAGDGFAKSAEGRLRDSKGRFTKAGDVAGQSASSGFDRGLKGVTGSIVKLAGAAGIGMLATASAKVGISTAANMETARIGFTTMLGSAQKADVFLRQLGDFAAATPFEFPELQTAASSLISAGIQADKVIPIMTTLGDVTAGMGTGSEGIQRATVALQQMSAAGRITGEDLNQLRDAGVPVYDLLAAATGRSKQEVVELAQAGKLGATELAAMMNALETGAGLERFNGLMAETSTSLSGLWSTLQDTFSMGMAEAIQPSIPMIKEGLGGAIAFVSDIMPELSSGIGSLIEGGQSLAPVVEALAHLLTEGVLPAASGLANILGGTLLTSSESATTAIGVLLAVMAARKLVEFASSITDMGTRMVDAGGKTMALGGKITTFGAGLGRVTSFLGGPWGIALGIGVTALIAFATKQSEAAKEAKGFTDQLTFQKGELDKNSAAMLAKKLADEGVLQAAKDAGIAEGDYVRAMVAGGDARQQMIDQLQRIAAEHTVVTGGGWDTVVSLDATGEAAKTAAEKLGSLGGGLDQSRHAAELATSATESLGDAAVVAGDQSGQLEIAQENLAGAQKTLKEETQKVIDKFTILRDGALGVEQANSAWEGSIDSLTKSVKSNRSALDSQVESGKLSKATADRLSRSLNAGTEAGRANRSSVIGMVSALNDKVVADFKATEKTKGLKAAQDQASGSIRAGRRAILDAAEAAGLNRKKVAEMIDQILQTPKERRTQFKTPGLSDADRDVRKYRDIIEGLKNKKNSVTTSLGFAAGKNFNRVIKGKYVNMGEFDTGGYTGPGDPSEPAGIVHHDEEVIKSSSRRRFESKFPGMLRYINTHGDLPPGHKDGGTVGRNTVTSSFNATGSAGQLPNVMREAAEYVARIGARQARGMGNDYLRQVAEAARAAEKRIAAEKAAAGEGGKIDVNNPSGRTTWKGGRFSNLFAANLRAAQKASGVSIHVYQGGFRPATSYSGTSHRGDALDSQASGSLIRALRRRGIASGDRTGLGNWVSHAHSVPGPNAGYAGGSAKWQWSDYKRRGGARQGLRSPWGLAAGTDWATPGVHETGEHGAELVVNRQFRRYKGGETVLNNRDTMDLLDDAEAGRGRRSRGPLIGSLTLQSSGNLTDDLDEVEWRLRTIDNGGVYAGASG